MLHTKVYNIWIPKIEANILVKYDFAASLIPLDLIQYFEAMKNKKINEGVVRSYALQLFKGLKHLHQNGIV